VRRTRPDHGQLQRVTPVSLWLGGGSPVTGLIGISACTHPRSALTRLSWQGSEHGPKIAPLPGQAPRRPLCLEYWSRGALGGCLSRLAADGRREGTEESMKRSRLLMSFAVACMLVAGCGSSSSSSTSKTVGGKLTIVNESGSTWTCQFN